MDSVQTTLTLCDLDLESTGNNIQELTSVECYVHLTRIDQVRRVVLNQSRVFVVKVVSVIN